MLPRPRRFWLRRSPRERGGDDVVLTLKVIDMTKVTAGEAVQAVLGQLTELAEICDSNGRVIGYFAPATLPEAASYANAAAHVDPAEIERFKRSKEECYTTKEVFEHLKSPTADQAMHAYLQSLIDEVSERDKCAAP